MAHSGFVGKSPYAIAGFQVECVGDVFSVLKDFHRVNCGNNGDRPGTQFRGVQF